MITDIEESVRRRSEKILALLSRRKLVFLHLGAAFEPLRDGMIDQLGGDWVSSVKDGAIDLSSGDSGTLFLFDLEKFSSTGTCGGRTLGQLRVAVDAAIDSGKNVCLISRVPANAFAPVPGSSLVEDASATGLPLLDPSEVSGVDAGAHWLIPEMHSRDMGAALLDITRELGVDLLVALDGAIFEAPLSSDYATLLEPREVAGLVSSGLLLRQGDAIVNPLERRMTELSAAVATSIAQITTVQPALASVTDSLWVIERTLRAALRSLAIAKFGTRWRTQLFVQDISAKVLDRARIDSYPLATSVAVLRDPIEWTTLGELLETFKREPFVSDGLDAIGWRKFSDDILPIRNRISHMRLVKNGDASTARRWAELVRKKFPL